MNGQTDNGNAIRGKRLHPDIGKRIIKHFQAGNFEEASFNAFKVVDERLRQITGHQGGEPMEVIKEAFHPVTGLLRDQSAGAGEREGMHQLIRGAFLAYRNAMGHRFVDPNEDEAFDIIVLANRIYLIAEEANQRRLTATATVQAPVIKYGREDYSQPAIFQLDIDNDGEIETIVPSHDVDRLFHVFKGGTGNSRPLAVGPINGAVGGLIDSMVLADVDGDGLNELVCAVGFDTSTGLMVFKYVAGRYEALHTPKSRNDENVTPLFIDAQLTDYDNDGRLEVVSEPWDGVPDDLMPEGRAPEDPGLPDWGRVRYVWKWDRARSLFELGRVLSLGG